MKLSVNRASIFISAEMHKEKCTLGIGWFCLIFLLLSAIGTLRAGTLPDHLKRITVALSNRNLDSLRPLIDPDRIYVEIAPKEGAFLTPSQTLGVIESFFHSQLPVSFSYLLIKEEGKTGIAVGTLIVADRGRTISHKVNFGFHKNDKDNWLLSRITIR